VRDVRVGGTQRTKRLGADVPLPNRVVSSRQHCFCTVQGRGVQLFLLQGSIRLFLTYKKSKKKVKHRGYAVA
jgi:hypothetical protein